MIMEWIFMIDCCCWWTCVLVMLKRFGDESCCCCWVFKKIGESLNFDEIMFDSWVLSILVFMFMCITYKLHLGRILRVGGSKLECWEKGVLKFEKHFLETWALAWASEQRAVSERAQAFSGHCTLKRAVSEQQASKNQCYGIGFAQANRKRTASEQNPMLRHWARSSEPQVA